MNNEIKKVQEDIDSIIDTLTLDIPVRVEATCVNDAPLEFDVSIDEVGQIILTPLTKDVEFVSADTDTTTNYDIPIIAQKTNIIIDDNLTRIKTSIVITAHMIAESDNHDISANIDDIGQVVIYPVSKENTFVSATHKDSLNLITESILDVHEYCDGYKLVNPGDGWYVRSPQDGLIAKGLESLNAAKIFVCKTEIERLSKLHESIEDTDDKENIPEVECDVIEESVSDHESINEFNFSEIEKAIIEFTDNFKDSEGILKCDTENESKICKLILKEYYDTVTVDNNNGFYLINYESSQLNEELSKEGRIDLINKFMQGEVPLLSDSGKPNESYIHIEELDSNGYSYYFDEESYSIVSYPEVQ